MGERLVPNADKILSLYEAEVEVLKRGKTRAEVEFGNKLWLAAAGLEDVAASALIAEFISDVLAVLPKSNMVVLRKCSLTAEEAERKGTNIPSAVGPLERNGAAAPVMRTTLPAKFSSPAR
jgi:hypothetical protein